MGVNHKGRISPHYIDKEKQIRECSKCKVIYPFSHFGKRNSPLGINASCRTCRGNIEKKKAWHYYIKHKYKLSPEDFESMIERSQGKCECCGSEEKLCIDHCHTTGKVRGLLCTSCNVALGLLKEAPYRAKALLDYMIKMQEMEEANNV